MCTSTGGPSMYAATARHPWPGSASTSSTSTTCTVADPQVPIADTIGAMAGLVTEGKARHLGVSEVTPAQLDQAAAVHPISAVQVEWSLLWRDPEDDIIPAARGWAPGWCPTARSAVGCSPPR